MLRELLLTSLAGLALVEISGRMAGTAFAAISCFGAQHLQGSRINMRLRGASGRGKDIVALLRAAPEIEKDQSNSTSSGHWSYAAAGLALTGAAVFCSSSRRRSPSVSMGWRIKFKNIYGDGTDSESPKVPEFILKRNKDKCPPWLTVERWEALPNKLKCRAPSYFMMKFKNDGTDRRPKGKKSRFTIPQAVDTLYEMWDAGLNEGKTPWSIEIMMHMNLDPKYPDQQIRMGVKLPHGVGKEKKVAVFCKPDEEEEVLEMGAAIAGQTLMNAINAEEFDFDVLIAKPMSMPSLAKLGKILGPRRLMPSPKSGTVVQDYKLGIDNFKSGGSIELRNNEHMMVACSVGSMSMGKDKIVANIRALLQEMADKAPEGAKAKEIMWRRMFMSGTRSPSLQLIWTEFPDHRNEELRKKSEQEKKKMLLSGTA